MIVVRLTSDQPGKISFSAAMKTPMSASVATEDGNTLVLKLGYEWNATTNRTLVMGDRDGFVGSVAFVF